MNNVIPMQIQENDIERLKKEYVRACEGGDSSDRDVAATAYRLNATMTAAEIATLHPRHKKRGVAYLISWAKNGYQGKPFGKINKPDHRDPSHRVHARAQPPLKSQENSNQDEDTEGAQHEDQGPEFLLTCAGQADHRAQLFLRHLPEVQLNEEQTRQILDFIHKAVIKWERIRRKLEKTDG